MPRGFGGGGRHQEHDPAELARINKLRSSRQRFRYFQAQWRKPRDTSDAFSPQSPGGSHWRRGLQWLRPLRGGVILVFVLGFIYTLLDAAWPILIGWMINVVEGAPDEVPLVGETSAQHMLALIGVVAFATVLASRGIGLVRGVLLHQLSLQAAHQIRSSLYARLIHLPLARLHELKSGGIVARLSSDVDHTANLLQQAVVSPISAVMRLVIVVAILLLYSWQLTVMSVGLLIILALIHHRAVGRIRPIYRSSSRDRAFIDGRVAETFGGIRVVRSFVRETRERLDYGLGHHTVLRKQIWARMLLNLYHSFWDLLLPAVHLTIIWVGGLYVLEGSLTIGAIVTIQVLSFQVMTPVMQIIQAMNETQRGMAALDRVVEVLDMDQELPDSPQAQEAPRAVSELSLEGVGFRYPQRRTHRDDVANNPMDTPRCDPQPDDQWVLRNISFRIAGGTVCALVGPSGAGKSTLVDLITRMMDPQEGRIALNGINIRDIRLRSYRSLLGVVSQEIFLFDGTVRENIAYGNRDACEDAVVDAAHQANAWEFIAELPEGLDTFIGERGVKMSGGQRQRIAIARAILADPAMLILDEATSSLDSANEQLIQESLNRLMHQRTTIVVAHRLATIRDADQIVVLEDGHVVELGDHQQLVDRGPGNPYYDMVQRQELLR